MNFVINTSDISSTKWLGIRPSTCFFTKYKLPEFKKKFCSKGFDSLGKFVSSLQSGGYIPKENYSITETNYIYLTVGNFSKGEIDFTEVTYLDNEVGEQYDDIRVKKGDLVITRSGTVGRVAIFEALPNFEEKKFIPSHHLAVVRTSTPQDHLFLKYYLNYNFCQDFFAALSTGKVQKEITNWSIKKIPIPLSLDKASLSERFKAIDNQINIFQLDNIPLQDSIDDVLINFGIKSKSSGNYKAGILITTLSNISLNKALRIGAEYNDFWFNHDGRLFEGTDVNFDVVRLKRIIKQFPKKTFKKGQLEEQKILVDFDQVESLNGKITDFENFVIEIGSDKIEFGECSFLTNKLRPYLGYTILNNPDLPLIGTTEFIPLDVRDESKVLVEYIRYLMLSNDYLNKSKLLMSGKEHPRINLIDILNIKVPLPKIEIQRDIVKEISKREEKTQKTREKIARLKAQVNEIILDELHKDEKKGS